MAAILYPRLQWRYTYINELRLYGCGMYTLIVEDVCHLDDKLRVILGITAPNVQRGYHLVPCQLPYVQLVHC